MFEFFEQKYLKRNKFKSTDRGLNVRIKFKLNDYQNQSKRGIITNKRETVRHKYLINKLHNILPYVPQGKISLPSNTKSERL